MKSILIVSAVFPPEPVVSAKLSHDLSEALSVSGKVMIAAPKPSRPYGFEFTSQPILNENSQLFYLESFICPESKIMGRLKEAYSFGKATFKFICQNHADIDRIYSNTWPLFAQYLTVRAAKKFNIPITIHVQDIYPESLSNKFPVLGKVIDAILIPVDRYVFKHANNIIAISEKMKGYLIRTRKVSQARISVVSNWQDEADFDKFNSSNNPVKQEYSLFTFMYLGNIGPVAGVDLLIDAFVKAGIADSRLVLAGAGSVKNQMKKRAEMYPDINIEFWDVPDGKVQAVQYQADVMLLPMKKGAASSSIPSKLPAYMFSKRPIIACVDEGSDTAIAIDSSNCGWRLPPENVNELCNKMIELSKMNKQLLYKMGEMGYNYAIENFSKKNNLSKLIKVIIK